MREERHKRARVKIRTLIDDAKIKPCADCGVEYPPYVMDFDHVRGEKLFNLGDAHNLAGYQQVLVELEKCDVVCATCHRIRTYTRVG